MSQRIHVFHNGPDNPTNEKQDNSKVLNAHQRSPTFLNLEQPRVTVHSVLDHADEWNAAGFAPVRLLCQEKRLLRCSLCVGRRRRCW